MARVDAAFAMVFLFAFTLCLAFVPCVVTADANVTLFADNTCDTQLGPTTRIPFSSSPACQPLPDRSSASVLFYCQTNVTSGYTNFSFILFNSTNCAGEPIESIVSYDLTSQCSNNHDPPDGSGTDVLLNQLNPPLSAIINCTAPASNATPQQQYTDDHSVLTTEKASRGVGSARRQRPSTARRTPE